ncbi:MAG: alpha/beta hydrolase [Bradymonadaceae bacterium]
MKPSEASSPLGRAMRQALRAVVRTPAPLAHQLFGEPPRNDRGAPLDLQCHVLLRMMAATNSPRLEELGAIEAREVYRRANQTFDLAPGTRCVVENHKVPGPAGELSARIYRPRSGTLPALVFYHGGGFVVGCLESYDGFCRAFAERADCSVISIDYRLAPEAPFPAAVEDSVAAFGWVIKHAVELELDASRIAVGGDSAGANLAAVVCQQMLANGQPTPAHQLLIYPKTDQTTRYPSRDLFAEGFYLTGPLVDWFTQCYLGDSHDPDCRHSPALFDDLESLPPTTVVTAGFDPLRDDGEAYAGCLRTAGVPVVEQRFDQLVHGFISMGGIIAAAAWAVADIAEEFGRVLRA